MEPIRSLTNPQVVAAGRLHRAKNRRATGRTLIEGPLVLAEAVTAGAAIKRTFILDEDDHTRWPNSRVVDPAVMAKLAGTETPRGPVAVLQIPEDPAIPADRDLIVAWGVGDPGNVGTLIRSAAAFDLGFVAGPDTADPWSPKALRAGAGAHFYSTPMRISSLDDLPSHSLAASVVSGGHPITALDDRRWAVLVGDEARGLGEGAVSRCDASVTIPMPGNVESLNAGAAGSIIAFALANRSSTRRPSN